MNAATLASPVPRSAARIDVARVLGWAAVYFTLLIFVLFFVGPLFVMITTSLKSMEEIRLGTLVGIPRHPTIQPWIDAWSNACVGVECTGLSPFFLNTIYLVVPATLIPTAIGALNGYALTQVNFRGQNIVYAIILFGCFAPYQAILIPLAQTLGKLGLAGTINGLILAHVVYGLPFTTMFFRNFFISVPSDLAKAARIDGAGFFQTFRHVMLPMSLPIMVVVIIWQFTSIWNDFLFGVAFTSGRNVPIMVALNNIVSSSTGERPYNVDMASAMLAALPTLLVYVFAGKYFVRGLMAGSVKG
ncbi:carbohydrate ABC transporter permease [Mesorhizobium sp. M0833]|uniref:carbohydrate ABC transporter permease n=1 Tax=unclassified Mesorhizobium TaxID=325217 RepID=UPI00333D80BD